MAPFPENNTDRLWVDYTSQGIKHSIMHRYAELDSPTTAEAIALGLATFYAGLLPSTDGVQGARVSLQGQDFSTPLTTAPIAGTGTGATWLEDPDAAFITLPFHGASTRNKGFLAFYAPLSFGQAWPTLNRYSAGQNALWNGIHDDWVDTVQVPIEGVELVNIAGNPVRFKGYLNFRKNGYRQTKQRT